jgi:hypothetical protein
MCGVATVSYEEGPPARCRNDRCTGQFPDDAMTKGRWFKCRPDGSKEADAVITRSGPAPAPPAPAPPELPPMVKIEADLAPLETRVSNPPETVRVTAEDDRHEWVAERVAELAGGVREHAWQDLSTGAVARSIVSAWEFAELLYDEGKKRGHLP